MIDFLEIPFEQDFKFFSFDITNMYSAIPITQLIKIIEIMCKQNNLIIEIKNEINKMCHIRIKKRIFSIYKPTIHT
jgi:hypothetical protein